MEKIKPMGKESAKEYSRLFDRLQVLINRGKEKSKEVERIRRRLRELLA